MAEEAKRWHVAAWIPPSVVLEPPDDGRWELITAPRRMPCCGVVAEGVQWEGRQRRYWCPNCGQTHFRRDHPNGFFRQGINR